MYKSLSKEIKDIDEKQGIVKFYANAFNNIDTDQDVSLPGSFTKTLKENLGRMRWFLNHGWGNDYALLGVPFIDGGIQDDFGLLATNKFNFGGTDLNAKRIARNTFEDYKIYAEFGRTIEHSIGVDAVKVDREEEENGMKIRYVAEWKCWEISTLTTWGSNDRAQFVELKDLRELDSTFKLLERMLKGKYTDDRLEKIEDTMNILKALTKEPLIDTHEDEPSGSTQNDEPLLKLINDNLKLLNYGRS